MRRRRFLSPILLRYGIPFSMQLTDPYAHHSSPNYTGTSAQQKAVWQIQWDPAVGYATSKTNALIGDLTLYTWSSISLKISQTNLNDAMSGGHVPRVDNLTPTVTITQNLPLLAKSRPDGSGQWLRGNFMFSLIDTGKQLKTNSKMKWFAYRLFSRIVSGW